MFDWLFYTLEDYSHFSGFIKVLSGYALNTVVIVWVLNFLLSILRGILERL